MKRDTKHHNSHHFKKPNILFIMVDQMRFPPSYETAEITAWREQNMHGYNRLRAEGFEFKQHHTASTACSPSRASLFTGQYPSLHGVSNTDGVAKGAFDDDMFWLDPNTVPDMGDYFREAGYHTFYKGKWHISEADILVPGTKKAYPSYDPNTGIPDPVKTKIYKKAERLDNFGWEGWIGPEPHGSDPRNSGSSAKYGLSGRDVVYTEEVIDLLKSLDECVDEEPWLVVASLVNPHDISLYGLLTANSPILISQLIHQFHQFPHLQHQPKIYQQNLHVNKIM